MTSQTGTIKIVPEYKSPPNIGRSRREVKKEAFRQETSWCGRICSYPLLQVPLALGVIASGVSGVVAFAFGAGTMAVIGGGAGAAGAAGNCLGWFCVGHLKTQKDLEELVQEDLRDAVQDFDDGREDLRQQMLHLHETKSEIASQLLEEKKITLEQAEKLVQLELLDANIKKTTNTIRQMVSQFDQENKELRDGVDGLDDEVDETKQHVDALGGAIGGLDGENAENLEQVERLSASILVLDKLVTVLVENMQQSEQMKSDLSKIVDDIGEQNNIIDSASNTLDAMSSTHQENLKDVNAVVEQVQNVLKQHGGITSLTQQIQVLSQKLNLAQDLSEQDLTD